MRHNFECYTVQLVLVSYPNFNYVNADSFVKSQNLKVDTEMKNHAMNEINFLITDFVFKLWIAIHVSLRSYHLLTMININGKKIINCE
jgi:hypothetical protein